MINWIDAEENELQLLESIKFLLGNHRKLLHFLFHPSKPLLRSAPEVLLSEAGVFSSGEYLLVQIAIDFWDGTGNAKLADIYSILDRDIYIRVLKTIENLKWGHLKSLS